MVLPLIGVGAKVTAAIINGITNLVNGNGSTLIVPTSVAGTGVSVTSLGRVNFTAATAVSLNGVFSAAYDDYLIVLDLAGASAPDDLLIRPRAAGTDQSGAKYVFTKSSITPGATAYTVSTGSAAGALLFGRADTGGSSLSGTLFSPYQPRNTRLAATGFDAGKYATQYWGALVDTSSYDGLTVLASVGTTTLTGSLRVYGLNNG